MIIRMIALTLLLSSVLLMPTCTFFTFTTLSFDAVVSTITSGIYFKGSSSNMHMLISKGEEKT